MVVFHTLVSGIYSYSLQLQYQQNSHRASVIVELSMERITTFAEEDSERCRVSVICTRWSPACWVLEVNAV